MFGRVVIVGVGLIGGSLALALKRANAVERVIGVGRNTATLDRALALGVIDEAAELEQAVLNADVVVICVPVAQTFSILYRLEPYLGERTLVTDVGSTKGDVIMAAKTALGDKVAQFIPAHPIAGREVHGVEAALPDLYDGRPTIICPLQENTSVGLGRIEALWEIAGAQVRRMAAVQHDAVFAAVSHLPHIAAYALMLQVANAEDAPLKLGFAGGGFRDFTRIAASSPEMWRDICLGNREAILWELDTYQAVLKHLRTKIAESDGTALEKLFTKASIARHDWAKTRS
jgi:prephenate dehydrogenase